MESNQSGSKPKSQNRKETQSKGQIVSGDQVEQVSAARSQPPSQNAQRQKNPRNPRGPKNKDEAGAAPTTSEHPTTVSKPEPGSQKQQPQKPPQRNPRSKNPNQKRAQPQNNDSSTHPKTSHEPVKAQTKQQPKPKPGPKRGNNQSQRSQTESVTAPSSEKTALPSEDRSKNTRQNRKQQPQQRGKQKNFQDSKASSEPQIVDGPSSSTPNRPGRRMQRGKKSSESNSQMIHCDHGEIEKPKKKPFRDHITKQLCETQIKMKKLFKGEFRINRLNPTEAYVTVEGEPRDIVILGLANMNRALHRDIVAIELIDPPRWLEARNQRKQKKATEAAAAEPTEEASAPVDKVPDEGSKTEDSSDEKSLHDDSDHADDEEGDGELGELDYEELVELVDESQQEAAPRKFGRVVCILEPNPDSRSLIGTLQKFTVQEGNKKKKNPGPVSMNDTHAFLVPTCATLPKIQIELDRNVLFRTLDAPPEDRDEAQQTAFYEEQLNGNFFSCKLLPNWSAWDEHPRGILLQNLGPCCETSSQYRALKLAHKILHTEEFPAECSAEFAHLANEEEVPLSEEERKDRLDLTGEFIFSIDPATAKDLDDALSCEQLPNGNFRVGVHIADVSHFVRQGSPLDREAQDRATTVYFVTENIPMLPRVLCDKLCSLQPDVERLCVSVIWELTPECEIKSCKFARSVIRSRAKLTYETAQRMIDHPEEFDAGDPDDLMFRCSVAVGHLHGMAKYMREHRFANGSLSLETPELSFELDENFQVTGMKPYIRGDSQFLVEEFMLLANRSVAEKLSKKFPHGALLRCHEPPEESKMKQLLDDCKRSCIPLRAGSSLELHESLQALEENYGPHVAAAVVKLATKPMKLAVYRRTEPSLPKECSRHYSLNFDVYTHFTSPIRRYADLAVHRMLHACVRKEKFPFTPEEIDRICDQSNVRKLNADRASRQCNQLYMNMFVHTQKGIVRDGLLLSFTASQMNVYVPDADFDGPIVFRGSKNVTIKKQEESVVITWKATKTLPQQSITVRLLSSLKVELIPTSERCLLGVGLSLIRPPLKETDHSDGGSEAASDSSSSTTNSTSTSAVTQSAADPRVGADCECEQVVEKTPGRGKKNPPRKKNAQQNAEKNLPGPEGGRGKQLPIPKDVSQKKNFPGPKKPPGSGKKNPGAKRTPQNKNLPKLTTTPNGDDAPPKVAPKKVALEC